MDEKRMKVSADEYKLLQKAKMRESEVFKDQLRRERESGIKALELRIKIRKRELASKRVQIESKNVIEKHPEFEDGKKPVYLLENEADEILMEIEGFQQQIKDIKEEMKKDESDRG